jgi:hypothetical protein
MTFEEAIKITEEDFELIKDTPHTRLVRTGLTYDGAKGFCVMLYDKGDRAIITDCGETKEVFDEVTEDEWKKLCKENGTEFNHWRIEKDFNGIEDLYEYIKFIDMISDKFFLADED